MIVRKQDLKLVPDHDLVLHKPPSPYDFEKHGSTAQLFANVLFAKMKEFKGVGLSANQVGIDASVFVIGVDDIRLDVFNPKIIATSGECLYNEGCLSYMGITVKVNRPEEIEVEYLNAKGEEQKRTFGGLTARIFLHEYDHMLGKTIKDSVSPMKWSMAIKKSKKSLVVAE
jgi:peptide deformylase